MHGNCEKVFVINSKCLGIHGSNIIGLFPDSKKNSHNKITAELYQLYKSK